MPHCAARSGAVIHLMNLNAASCSAGVRLLEDVEVAAAGRAAAPLAGRQHRHAEVELGVVLARWSGCRWWSTSSRSSSRRSPCGVVPHSMTPGGMHLVLARRGRPSTAAPRRPRACRSRSRCRRRSSASTPFWVVRPWNSQYGKPEDGICDAPLRDVAGGVALRQLLRVLEHARSRSPARLFGIEAGLLEQRPCSSTGRWSSAGTGCPRSCRRSGCSP